MPVLRALAGAGPIKLFYHQYGIALPSRPGKTTRLIKALPGNSDVPVPVSWQIATMPQQQFARNSLPTVIARVFSKSVRNSPGGSKKRVQRSLISG